MWENLAFAPLTCLLFAASSAATGLGMEWVLEAAEDVNAPATPLATVGQDQHRPIVGDRGFMVRQRIV